MALQVGGMFKGLGHQANLPMPASPHVPVARLKQELYVRGNVFLTAAVPGDAPRNCGGNTDGSRSHSLALNADSGFTLQSTQDFFNDPMER